MLSSSPSASSLPPHLTRSTSLPSNHTVYKPTSSEKLTLTEFVSQYHKSLPLPIRVCRGYCGPSEETSISEGDHFNVHFIKHTTVVLVEMDNGNQYNVPLNSAVPFGILYDPQKSLSQACKGYTFTKVGDILQQAELPLVVRARRAHASSNSENSISANELFIVRSAARKRIGKNHLKVFSLTEKREKTLSEGCIGHFSTKPRDVCLYLPDIVNYAPDIFPCRAILFASKESSLALPTKLSSTAVTLMHHSIETSLVVTSALGEDDENTKMLDIPIDLSIQVRVATVTEVEAQKLARSTAYLYSNFNPSKLKSYVRSAETEGMEQTQNLLYRTIRRGSQQQRGIRITRPQSILIPEREDTSSHSSPSSYPTPSDIYDDIMPLNEGEEPHYMSPRPVGQASSPPTLPERNKTTRTPGYSYVDVDVDEKKPPLYSYVDINDVRSCTPNRATRALGPVAMTAAGCCDPASRDSSFGSTGSGGAIVERSMGGAAGWGSGSEYSNRSSYSEGDLEVKRERHRAMVRERGGAGMVGEMGAERNEEMEKLRAQEQELDTCLLDLKDMTDELDTVLLQQEKEEEEEEEEEEKYSTLQHGGPPLRKSPPRSVRPEESKRSGSTAPTLVMETSSSHLTSSGQLELSEDMRQHNRAYVRSLDSLQILKMLNAMGLSEYQERFSSQQVNGDLFLECDEKMLEKDLKVVSKLHRIRLLKVISGDYSVSKILSGRDGYVTMHPCK